MGCISVYRHCDWAARLPGEEVDEPEGKMESLVEGWRLSFWDPARGRAECLTWGHLGQLCSGQS